MKKCEIFERYFVVFFAGFSLALILAIPLSCINDELTEKKLKDQEAIIKDQQNMINSYVNKLEKKCPECKDCGVNEYEKGYIIDGYYYEFKGEADIQMEQ